MDARITPSTINVHITLTSGRWSEPFYRVPLRDLDELSTARRSAGYPNSTVLRHSVR
jgi:hypothetical protein